MGETCGTYGEEVHTGFGGETGEKEATWKPYA